MSQRLGASMTIIRERHSPFNNGKKSAEILIRKVPEDSQFIDIRIAVLGNVDTGKSTLISVLTHNEMDNGQGKARLNLLRHIHEIQSGRTSSISNEIMGFNNMGEVQNFGNCRSAEEICENSSKIMTFIDLAGHSKYMKTTVFGLTGYAPDFTMLVINANNGIVGTAKEHLGFSMALEVRVFVVINKTDLCTEKSLQETIDKIEFLLKSPGCGKIPMMIKSDDDAVLAAQHFVEPKICPIFTISCVDGTYLDKLRKFLNVLPPFLNSSEKESEMQQLPEFRVDEVYFKKKPGHILAGMLTKGSIQERQNMLLGPFEYGDFLPVEIQTVQRYRVPCRMVRAGQSAALSIGNPKKGIINEKLRKGMVLVDPRLEPKACRDFQSKIYLLFHANQICKGFQATIHVGNVCQTARIIHMDRDSLKTNESATVIWRFCSRVEYIKPGSRLIFREGTTKGMGEVTETFTYEQSSSNHHSSSDDFLKSIRKKKRLRKISKSRINAFNNNIKSLLIMKNGDEIGELERVGCENNVKKSKSMTKMNSKENLNLN
jgi:GTPase